MHCSQMPVSWIKGCNASSCADEDYVRFERHNLFCLGAIANPAIRSFALRRQAIIFPSHCGRDAGPNEWNRQKPRKAWVESRYCWFCELWLRSVKVREKLVAGVVPKLSAVTTLSILFPPSLTTKWSLPET